MASDWPSDATYVLNMVNITFDDTGAINHVGVGFDVALSSGRKVASSGYTWTPTTGHLAALQAAMNRLASDLGSEHGVGVGFPQKLPGHGNV